MKIYQVLAFVLVFGFLSISSPAQDNNSAQMYIGATISGVINDSETAIPLSAANIVLLKTTDSSIVTGAISSKNGKFIISKVPTGTYIVKADYLGYKANYYPDILIRTINDKIDMGVISLSQTSEMLAGVEVTAERTDIEYKMGKKIINVDKNMAGAGGTAIDVMRNIPSVDVDVDGNISLRGSANVNIQIDGKASSLVGNGSSALDQIPAGAIEKVEIINNPSAKYDPDGMSGIINIVLKKEKAVGVNGLVSMNVGSGDKYGASSSLNYRYSDFNVYGSYDFKADSRPFTMLNSTKTTDSNSTFLLDQTGLRHRKDVGNSFRGGFDYFVAKGHTFSVSAVYRDNGEDNTNNVNNNYTQKISNAVISDNYYYRSETEKEPGKNLDVNVGWKSVFKESGSELTADFSLSRSDDANILTLMEQNYDALHNKIPDPLQQNNYTHDLYKNYTFQTDFATPLWYVLKLEAGYKTIIRSVDADYTSKQYSYTSNNWQLDPNATNNFVYDENIHSVYSTVTGNWDPFEFQVGLRVEASLNESFQKTTGIKNNTDLFNLFPSGNLTYKLDKISSIQANYSRRINRPSIHSLNPFIDYSDSKNLRYGNPNLKPEFINAYELGYVHNFTNFTIAPTIFYREINNVMTRFKVWLHDDVFGNTMENMASAKSYGMEMNISEDFVKWWRVTADLSYYKYVIEGNKFNNNITNEDFTWSTKINQNFSLTKSTFLQLMFNYRAPTVTAQGTRDAIYFTDISARQELMEGKLTLTFRVSDVFNTMKFHHLSYGENFYADNTFKRDTRIAYFGISYKLNEGLKQKDRKRTEENQGGDEGF